MLFRSQVMKAVLSVMRYWLDMGIDGLRLDAIPYLIERDGTNNENLPETHDVLKQIRAEIDAHYPDRMLLAEANQWPEDTQLYFGDKKGDDGDECHMAFHFPLMPRMYMALAYTRIVAPIDGDVVGIVTQEGQTVIASQLAPTVRHRRRIRPHAMPGGQ